MAYLDEPVRVVLDEQKVEEDPEPLVAVGAVQEHAQAGPEGGEALTRCHRRLIL